MTDDNFKELLRTLDRQTRAIEDVKRAVDYGTAATERVQREVWWLFIAIMTIAATLFASGCAPSPMADWRDDITIQCADAAERLRAECPESARLDCAARIDRADDRCLGPLERVFDCWADADAWVSCASVGLDVGSLCDVEEWELRTCIYPELRS